MLSRTVLAAPASKVAKVFCLFSSEKKAFLSSCAFVSLVRDICDIECAAGRVPLSHVELAPAAESAPRPPAFLLGPANESLLWEIYGQTHTHAVRCYAIEGAQVAPRGIAIKDRVALHAQTFLQPRHHVVEVCDRLNNTTLPIRHVPGPLAIIYGPGHETWGHWLTDFLPRLWVLHAAGHDLAALRYLVPPDLKDFALKLLRSCGLRDEQLVAYDYWSEVIETDLLLMPTGLRAANRLAACFAEATRFWINRAAPATKTVEPHRKLFVSRASVAQERTLLNRGDIESIAAAAGFEMMRPEALGLLDQIRMFAEAHIIVGEYGSALHGAVFSSPGTIVCALRGTSRHPGFIQSGIGTAMGQDCAYLFMDSSGQDVVQSFAMDTGLFTRALEMLEVWRK